MNVYGWSEIHESVNPFQQKFASNLQSSASSLEPVSFTRYAKSLLRIIIHYENRSIQRFR